MLIEFILLEIGHNKDPQQLITTPTLLPDHVAPNKRKLLTLKILISASIGSVVAIVQEERKDIIYSVNQIDLLWKIALLAKLSLGKKIGQKLQI